MNPTIKEAGELKQQLEGIKLAGKLKQQLEADIANLLNTYIAATGLRITNLTHDITLARGTEPVTYTVSVEVKL